LELTLKALRMIALTALITVDPRISQITHLPTWALSQSIAPESFKSPRMLSPSVFPQVEKTPDCQVESSKKEILGSRWRANLTAS
jgi:hypothetical protein